MRVLFVNLHTGSGTFPLASACLASALEARFGDSIECPILELAPGFSLKIIVGEIITQKPDIVALTLYVWSRKSLLALAAELKSRISEFTGTPSPPIILAGGPEVSADPASIQAHPAVDLAVPGEGELSIIKIVETLIRKTRKSWNALLSDFPNPFPSIPIPDFDSLPSAFNARALTGRRYEDTVWELTRGCPFSCHFCYESKGEKLLRSKSLARVRMEMAALKSRGSSRIFILDPTFNANPQRAKDYLRLFLDHQKKAPELQFHMEIRSEFLDEEQADLFAELGAMLQIGLQSAVPEVARGIGRPYSIQDYRDKVNILHQAGASFGLDLIYGLPDDNLAGFKTSLNFALECRPNHLDIFPLAVLPGTRLRDDAAKRQLEYDSQTPYLVSGSATFPENQLREADKLKAAVDELYNRGRALPWFLVTASTLELSPVEMLEAFANAATDKNDGRPIIETIREFINDLANQTNHNDKAAILADIATYFSCESLAREGDQLPPNTVFSYQAQRLAELLEMGIDDVDELAAFTPKEPGSYTPVITGDGLIFERLPASPEV